MALTDARLKLSPIEREEAEVVLGALLERPEEYAALVVSQARVLRLRGAALEMIYARCDDAWSDRKPYVSVVALIGEIVRAVESSELGVLAGQPVAQQEDNDGG